MSHLAMLVSTFNAASIQQVGNNLPAPVAQDETVLDRLAVGKVALELLPELRRLGITASSQSFRTLALDPDLDAYILSFEGKGSRE